ncbi:hypothetical protein Tco_1496140 [Tanacetum coccineum]
MLCVFPNTLIVPQKGGWTDYPQEPLIPWISLKRPLSKGIVRHLRPLSSLGKSITSNRKAMKHYTRLGKGTMTCFTNSQLTISIAIKSLSSKNIDSNNSFEGIAAIVSKLDSLGRDIKKLKENVHAIQPSLGEKKPSLTDIINKYIEESAKRHVEQDERLRKFYQDIATNQENHDKIIQGLETKVKTLTNKFEGQTYGECKEIFTKDGSPLYTPFYYSSEEIEYFFANSGFYDDEKQETKESGDNEGLATIDIKPNIEQAPQEEKQDVSYYVEPYEPPIPFPRRLEHHAEEALVHETIESLKKIRINRSLLKEIRQTNNYAKHMKGLVDNKPKIKEDDKVRMNPRCSALLQNQLPPKE